MHEIFCIIVSITIICIYVELCEHYFLITANHRQYKAHINRDAVFSSSLLLTLIDFILKNIYNKHDGDVLDNRERNMRHAQRLRDH